MIPIIVGPQGPGYTSIYVDNERNIIQLTTPPVTEIPIGLISCTTGVTGTKGPTGPAGIMTGPSSDTSLTGATGVSLDAVLYNPTECKLRFIYNDNRIDDFESLECKQPPTSITGATGPTGANVEYVVLYDNLTVQTIYSDNSVLNSTVCCICPALTGYTGLPGEDSEYGATGPTGADGIISNIGSTGPTGPISNAELSTVVNINAPTGPYGAYIYKKICNITIPGPLQFNVNTNDGLRRNHIATNQRAEILFPNTPFNVNISSTTTNVYFTPISEGLQSNISGLIRIHMNWTSNFNFIRPFAVLNLNVDQFPTILSTSYPRVTSSDDMLVYIHQGDIITILPGTYLKYPISPNQSITMQFSDIEFYISCIYIL